MKYVNRVVGRDGKERLYFRRKGCPSIALQAAWESPELASEVEALVLRLEPAKALPGLLRGALRDYELKDADFAALADSTKYLYRLILGEFEETLGDVPVGSFTAGYILDLRNAWAERGHRAANCRLQVLKNVLWPCIVREMIGNGTDPFGLIPQVRRPDSLKEPHTLWPLAAVETVIAAAIKRRRFGLARAIAIARYTGARRDDLARMTKAVRRGGRFAFLSGKRKVPVDIPEDPELTRWLDLTPDFQPDEPRNGRKVPAGVRPVRSLVLVFNLAGVSYTANGLGLEIGKLVDALHKAGELATDTYDLHGLRHTRGVELALAGCTDAEGAAQLGHASPSSFAQYRRQADRIRMSDNGADKVRALRERAGNGEVQNDLQNRCKTTRGSGLGPGA